MWRYSDSHIQVVKTDNLAENKLTDSPQYVSEWNRVHRISLDAHLYGDRCRCAYTLEMIKCFDSKLQGLSRQVGSDWSDPPLLILRLLKLICNLIQLHLLRARSAGPTGGLMFPLLAVGGVLLRWGLESWGHSGPEFWFCWYMEALSFSRTRHRWQLQLPVNQGGRQHIISLLSTRSQSLKSPLCSETYSSLNWGECVWYLNKFSSKISTRSWDSAGAEEGWQEAETTDKRDEHFFQCHGVSFSCAGEAATDIYKCALPLPSVNLPSGGSVMGGLRQYMW